jgi:large subunit ribosomal protein L4
MRLDILNIKGEKTGKSVELPDNIFAIEPNEHAIYLSVKQFLANQRHGNHKSKERSEMSGSTRKLHRQKGTGGSRKGDINNPLYRGGGRVFGPKPHDYNIYLNKKVKNLAKKSALSVKAANGQIKIVEDFTMDAPNTKNYRSIMKSLNLDGAKSLLVLTDSNTNIVLSSNNLKGAEVRRASDINTYDLMNTSMLLISEGAVTKVVENLD